MYKVKCANGHFYDAERFQTCPICGSSASVALKEKSSKKAVDEISKTEPLLSKRKAGGAPVELDEQTLKNVDELAPTELIQREDELRLEAGMAEEYGTLNQESNATEPDVVPVAHIHHDVPQSPLKAVVEQTGSQHISALPKTVSYYDMDENEPPVGWLVCVKGSYRGRSFECHVGRNRIGRSPELEICLTEDTAVTRESHAIVIYEPKQRSFYLQAGTGDGLAYLNGNVLFAHEELHPYDHLALGNSEFVFLPLCGDCFSWDEYITKE